LPCKYPHFGKETDKWHAKQILEQVSFADMPAFLDYARAEAGKTRFDVQSLGGVKQYLASYLASRERRAASTAATAARQQRTADEGLQAAYISFRRSRAKAIFQTLPAEQKAAIEALAKGGSKNAFSAKAGSLGSLMLELDIAKITAERDLLRFHRRALPSVPVPCRPPNPHRRRGHTDGQYSSFLERQPRSEYAGFVIEVARPGAG
jgi:hypothetical protein